MSKERSLILAIEDYTNNEKKINKFCDKYNVDFLSIEKVRFLPKDMFQISKFIVDILIFLSLFLLFVLFIPFKDLSFNDCILSLLLLFVSLISIDFISKHLIAKNCLSIKEKLILFELKIFKDKRHKYLKRKAEFNKDKKEITKRISELKSSHFAIERNLKHIDVDILTDEYIELITSEKIVDDQLYVLNVLIFQFPLLCQEYVVEQIKAKQANINYLEY